MVQSDGPLVWENWRAWESAAPLQKTLECAFYSDAALWPSGRVDVGPYQVYFLPTWGEATNAPILVRLQNHLPDGFGWSPDALRQTEESRYHGGWLEDEIAALISLCLRVRVAFARTTRSFLPRQDPSGLPILEDYQPVPRFRLDSGRAVIPRALNAERFRDLDPLHTLCRLSSADAVALVRAARLYQQALAVAEIDPNLCWLFLVSSIEAAAVHWKGSINDPVGQLRRSKPALTELLKERGGEELVAEVSAHLADQLAATRKFISFALTFMPGEPEVRPSLETTRHPWTRTALKKSLSDIYGYRSRALHGGTPFPAPMSESHPIHLPNPPAEVYTGTAVGYQNATWLRKALPMQLHLFEHIVQGALMKWWDNMQSNTSASIS